MGHNMQSVISDVRVIADVRDDNDDSELDIDIEPQNIRRCIVPKQ